MRYDIPILRKKKRTPRSIKSRSISIQNLLEEIENGSLPSLNKNSLFTHAFIGTYQGLRRGGLNGVKSVGEDFIIIDRKDPEELTSKGHLKKNVIIRLPKEDRAKFEKIEKKICDFQFEQYQQFEKEFPEKIRARHCTTLEEYAVAITNIVHEKTKEYAVKWKSKYEEIHGIPYSSRHHPRIRFPIGRKIIWIHYTNLLEQGIKSALVAFDDQGNPKQPDPLQNDLILAFYCENPENLERIKDAASNKYELSKALSEAFQKKDIFIMNPYGRTNKLVGFEEMQKKEKKPQDIVKTMLADEKIICGLPSYSETAIPIVYQPTVVGGNVVSVNSVPLATPMQNYQPPLTIGGNMISMGNAPLATIPAQNYQPPLTIGGNMISMGNAPLATIPAQNYQPSFIVGGNTISMGNAPLATTPAQNYQPSFIVGGNTISMGNISLTTIPVQNYQPPVVEKNVISVNNVPLVTPVQDYQPPLLIRENLFIETDSLVNKPLQNFQATDEKQVVSSTKMKEIFIPAKINGELISSSPSITSYPLTEKQQLQTDLLDSNNSDELNWDAGINAILNPDNSPSSEAPQIEDDNILLLNFKYFNGNVDKTVTLFLYISDENSIDMIDSMNIDYIDQGLEHKTYDSFIETLVHSFQYGELEKNTILLSKDNKVVSLKEIYKADGFKEEIFEKGSHGHYKEREKITMCLQGSLRAYLDCILNDTSNTEMEVEVSKENEIQTETPNWENRATYKTKIEGIILQVDYIDSLEDSDDLINSSTIIESFQAFLDRMVEHTSNTKEEITVGENIINFISPNSVAANASLTTPSERNSKPENIVEKFLQETLAEKFSPDSSSVHVQTTTPQNMVTTAWESVFGESFPADSQPATWQNETFSSASERMTDMNNLVHSHTGEKENQHISVESEMDFITEADNQTTIRHSDDRFLFLANGLLTTSPSFNKGLELGNIVGNARQAVFEENNFESNLAENHSEFLATSTQSITQQNEPFPLINETIADTSTHSVVGEKEDQFAEVESQIETENTFAFSAIDNQSTATRQSDDHFFPSTHDSLKTPPLPLHKNPGLGNIVGNAWQTVFEGNNSGNSLAENRFIFLSTNIQSTLQTQQNESNLEEDIDQELEREISFTV